MQLPFGAFIIEKILDRFSINKLTFYRSFILVITYLIYFVYRLTRKPLSIVKSQLYHHNCSQYAVNQTFQTHNTTNWCDWSPFDTEDAKTFLGLLDTLYLFSYAIFMFMAGYVAERSNLRYFLATSLIICGIFCYLFGIAFYLNIHYFYYFIIIQILTGIAQSTGFPAVMAVVGKWFDSTKKGLIFGIWNSHGSLGNVAGAAIAGNLIQILSHLAKYAFNVFFNSKIFIILVKILIEIKI
jgi:OPA family glycerol-3-phosphate transporter-like MFS transporter 1/2